MRKIKNAYAIILQWCKFDDDVVSRAAYRDAVTANYGGDDPEIGTRSYSNAYMLVYIKKSEISNAWGLGKTQF